MSPEEVYQPGQITELLDEIEKVSFSIHSQSLSLSDKLVWGQTTNKEEDWISPYCIPNRLKLILELLKKSNTELTKSLQTLN